MSNTKTTTRSSETQSAAFMRLGLDKNELKSIKVAITRRNVSEPNTTSPLLRSLDDPSTLVKVVHYRPDEGVRPIFDREDIIVNKEEQEERKILASQHQSSSQLPHPSRDSSQSSQNSLDRNVDRNAKKKVEKKSLSPEPHTSRTYPKDDYRKDLKERDKYYAFKSRRSRSPPGHAGPSFERRRSRSPPPKVVEKRRTPPKYRGPPERRRSRTPPPRRRSRGRSRSYSPQRRSRYSRSPHRRDDRRYERSRRSPRRSRSPRRRHTPERQPPENSTSRMPNPYFEGAEFWIPNPMLQPFIPRQMIPPGAFPYPFRPGMPPMMPPRMPFRPRIVYNSNRATVRTTPTSTSSTPAIESSVTTTTTAGTSKESKEGGNEKVISKADESDHSAEN